MKETELNNYYISELQRLVNIDQEVRSRSILDENEITGIDKRNGVVLKKLIEKFGFPTISKVGRQGSENAFCLVQHQDKDLQFMESFLKEASSISKAEYVDHRYAFLFDRVAVNNRRKQRFGTQCMEIDGKIVVKSLEFSIKETNKLRREWNIVPYTLDEYILLMGGDESVLDKYI